MTLDPPPRMTDRAIARHTLHLLDPRPPQDVQARLEFNVDAVFLPRQGGDEAARTASFRLGAAHYTLTLAWQGAVPSGQRYTLVAVVDAWLPTADLDWERQRCLSWLSVWTSGLQVLDRPPRGTASQVHRRAVLAAWRAAEAALADPVAVQQHILQALRGGQRLARSDKEGTTTITFDGGRFVRRDEGEAPGARHFERDDAFLAFLRQFYAAETGRRCWPAQPPEADAWRLIFRRLRG